MFSSAILCECFSSSSLPCSFREDEETVSLSASFCIDCLGAACATTLTSPRGQFLIMAWTSSRVVPSSDASLMDIRTSPTLKLVTYRTRSITTYEEINFYYNTNYFSLSFDLSTNHNAIIYMKLPTNTILCSCSLQCTAPVFNAQGVLPRRTFIQFNLPSLL